MATQGHATDISVVAGADLRNSQFRAVAINASGLLVLATNGGPVVGILQNKPNLNEPATVRISGISKVVASGAFAAGVDLASDAVGKAKVAVAGRTNTVDAGATADALIGSFVWGLAMEPATADNHVISALIDKRGAIPTTAA